MNSCGLWRTSHNCEDCIGSQVSALSLTRTPSKGWEKMRSMHWQEKKGKRKREAPEVAPLERFEEDELRDAKLLLEEEAQAMRAALGHPLLDPLDDAPVRLLAPLHPHPVPCTGCLRR